MHGGVPSLGTKGSQPFPALPARFLPPVQRDNSQTPTPKGAPRGGFASARLACPYPPWSRCALPAPPPAAPAVTPLPPSLRWPAGVRWGGRGPARVVRTTAAPQAGRAPPPPDSCGSDHRGELAKAFNAAVAGPRSFRGAVAATPEGSTGSAVMATHLAVC